MHGAGAAERHAAAELRAGHAEHVAQHPEEWRVAVNIDAMCVPVDFNGEGHGILSFLLMALARWRTRANADQILATSTTASAKACGASWGRLCPMPPLMSRCAYLPENFLA